MFTRVVWSASAGTSVPRAMMRISPAFSSFSPIGGTDQPMSICPDITCVSVAPAPPVGVGCAFTPACCSSASSTRLDDDPAAENAAVWPPASFIERIGPFVRAYQNRSDAPCHSASITRTGAPFTAAASTPSVPVPIPISHPAGNHRLLRLRAAVGVEDVEVQALLLEEPGALTPDGDAGVPKALLADGELQRFRLRRMGDQQRQQHARAQTHRPYPRRSLRHKNGASWSA